VSQRRFRGKAIKTSFFGGDERVGPTRPMSNGPTFNGAKEFPFPCRGFPQMFSHFARAICAIAKALPLP